MCIRDSVTAGLAGYHIGSGVPGGTSRMPAIARWVSALVVNEGVAWGGSGTSGVGRSDGGLVGGGCGTGEGRRFGG
eukprot:6777019-Prorocentrum_lima.AAC.1